MSKFIKLVTDLIFFNANRITLAPTEADFNQT